MRSNKICASEDLNVRQRESTLIQINLISEHMYNMGIMKTEYLK